MIKKYVLKTNFGVYICKGLNDDRAEYYDTTLDECRAVVFDSLVEAMDVREKLTYDHINGDLFHPEERYIK